MRHLAIAARSVNCLQPYTTAGLGDRIHSVTLGWVYGHGEPVTVHLTRPKWTGGQFGNKPESWAEIVGLFPTGSVQVCQHDVAPATEREWLPYLRERGFDVRPYCYGDYPGPRETIAPLDISRYLRRIPHLTATSEMDLPERFVTVQWDAGGPSRRLSPRDQQRVIDRFAAEGYAARVVGGEATDERLRWSLKCISGVMSRATFHVGVDSAFMHLALLYMEPERIHIYSRAAKPSHHVLRAVDMGSSLNRYL